MDTSQSTMVPEEIQILPPSPNNSLGNSPSINYTWIPDTNTSIFSNVSYDGDQSFSNISLEGLYFLNGSKLDIPCFDDIYCMLPRDEIIDEITGHFYGYKQLKTIILIVLYTLAFILGFFGNLLVIFIFTKNRKMRTVTNSFLVNLAICDLLVVCVCMPFTISYEIYNNWIYGDIWCKVVNFSQGLSISASIITLTVISAERFYAVNHPLKARAFMSRSRVFKIIVCIWIVSALTVLPALIVRKKMSVVKLFTVEIFICTEDWSSLIPKHVYNFTVFFILYILPVSFICIGYLRIGISLWRRDSDLHAGPRESTSANRTLIGRRKVARMLFVMAILFAMSWLPFHVMSLSMDLFPVSLMEKHGMFIRLIYSYATWLGHSNSSINPICYCIMSQSFKHAIKLEMMRCCHGKYIDSAKTTYYAPSMSLTMSTSGAATRSRITPCSRNGYRLVTNGSTRHGMRLMPVNHAAKIKGLRRNLSDSDLKGTPDLLKHISTNI